MTVIIDVFNLYHKLAYYSPQKNDSDNLVKGKYNRKVCNDFIDYVISLKQYTGPDDPIILVYDNICTPEYVDESHFFKAAPPRESLYPYYKKNRKRDKKSTIFNDLYLIESYFFSMDDNYYILKIPRLEADDIIYNYIINHKDTDILVISNDSDVINYSNERVYFKTHLNSYPEKGYDLIKEKYGRVLPLRTRFLFKSLFGDSSDNIPSVVPASHEKTFFDIIDLNEGDIDLDTFIALLYKLDQNNKSFADFVRKIENNIVKLRVNWQLVLPIVITPSELEEHCAKNNNTLQVKKTIDILLNRASPNFVFGGLVDGRGRN